MGFVVFRVIRILQRQSAPCIHCSPAKLPRYILTLKILYNIYILGSERLASARKCPAYSTILIFLPSKS